MISSSVSPKKGGTPDNRTYKITPIKIYFFLKKIEILIDLPADHISQLSS